jgi:N-acetylneuraminic acid mutarotase
MLPKAIRCGFVVAYRFPPALALPSALAAALSALGFVHFPAMAQNGPPVLWRSAADLAERRYQHAVTRLLNGELLVTGGRLDDVMHPSAEIYNPWSGMWRLTAPMQQGRYYHSATLLRNNQVLVAGGINLIDGHLLTAELYDPAAGTWRSTGSMIRARREHTATLLPDGSVLVAGGHAGYPMAPAEVYDPITGQWSETGWLLEARQSAAAALLSTGQVLTAGGTGATGDLLTSAELYDPSARAFTRTGALAEARDYSTLTTLSAREVIAIGGRGANGQAISSAEIYDVETGTWRATGRLRTARYDHRVSTLLDGRLLITAGVDVSGTLLASVEIYDPHSGTFEDVPGLSTARYGASVSALMDGGMLAVGGNRVPNIGFLASTEARDAPLGQWNEIQLPNVALRESALSAALRDAGAVLAGPGDGLSGAAIFDPAVKAWRDVPPMSEPRQGYTAVTLMNGRALVTGGRRANGDSVGTSEVLDLVAQRWEPVSSLRTPRSDHRALLLPDGRVLVAGGRGTAPIASAEVFDPASGDWHATAAMMTPRQFHTMNLLSDGRVIVVGGVNADGEMLASVEIFDPATGQWQWAAPLSVPRAHHTATILTSGLLLIAGGQDAAGGLLRHVELFDVRSSLWREGPSLKQPRSGHRATLLSDASLLVFGGAQGSSAERYVPPGVASTVRPVISDATLTPDGDLRIVGLRFTDYLPRSGGGFQEAGGAAPVVSVMSLSNEQFGMMTGPGASAWSETEIVTVLKGELPPGPALLVVHDSRGGMASRIVEIVVRGPTITSQPQSRTIQSGTAATMSVAVSGTPPLSYQWYAGTSGTTAIPIAGATSSDYTTSPLANTTNYWVRVSDPYGSFVDSVTATITVVPYRPFTDETLAPRSSVMRAVHITELRQRIDALRLQYGLAPYSWNGPTPSVGTLIRAQHLIDLRAALADAYNRAGLTAPTYTDQDVSPGATIISVAHITELRNAVIGLELRPNPPPTE